MSDSDGFNAIIKKCLSSSDSDGSSPEKIKNFAAILRNSMPDSDSESISDVVQSIQATSHVTALPNTHIDSDSSSSNADIARLLTKTISLALSEMSSDENNSITMASSHEPSNISGEFVDTEHEEEQRTEEDISGVLTDDSLSCDEVDLEENTSWVKKILRLQYFADPGRWCSVWNELPCLTPSTHPNAWLSNEIMEWYILNQLNVSLGTQQMIYIPIGIIQHLRTNPLPIDEAISTHFTKFQKMQRSISNNQAAFMICQDNHWFAVVFDWDRQCIWTFNRQPSNSSSIKETYDTWNEWNGPQLWKSVPILLNWTPIEGISSRPFAEPRALSWAGDGINCGTECVSILKDLIFTHGLQFPSGHTTFPIRPTLRCWQWIRNDILNAMADMLHTAYQFWKRHHESNSNIGKNWMPPWLSSEDLELFDTGIRLSPIITKLQRQLVQAIITCKVCPEHTSKLVHEDETFPSQHNGHEHTSAIQSSSSVVREGSIFLTDVRKIVRRERHAEALHIPTSALKVKRPRMLKHFDQLNTGPTVQDNMDIPQHVKNIPIFYRTQLEPLSIYSLWRDYGYRIDSHFALNFNSKVPYHPAEHYLPIADNTGEYILIEQLKQWSLARGEHERMAITQIHILGMKEMLNIAGDKGSPTSVDLFTRGIYYNPPICDNLEFIHLDVSQDAYDVPDIHVSLDIDSLIWTTPDLHFNMGIKVFMSPVIRDRPPISVHNHRSVYILPPQSDIQRANNEYTCSVRTPLSRIPHIFFGQFGEGAGSGNIYVFFPRMIHRQQDSAFWATLVPTTIQDIWFSCVIQPAIKRIAALGTMEYLDFTPEEWKAKANYHRGNPESRVVSERKIKQFVQIMRDIIQEDPDLDDLHIFGSLFFVVEIRGCKLIVKASEDNDILMATQRAIPTLDLDYMATDPYSECVLDLGMSLTPQADIPLVGLWRLTHVDASFAKAGTNQPVMHPMGTLSDHGSLQAEFPKDRSSATHMVFRSAYNLVFEIVRGGVTFCENADAYAGNAAFHKCINRYISLYRNARERTYGVRDEYRMSIQAIRDVLPVAIEKAKALASSGAVTWVPSTVFFDFWIRRMQELKQVQLDINRKKPSSRCSTTLLLMHLFKSIITTPTVDSLTRSLLRDVNFQAVIDRFGIFSLQTQSSVSLEMDQIQGDADDVIAFVTNPTNKKKAKQSEQMDIDIRRTAEYPLGTHPTWQQVTETLLTDPATLVSTRCGNNFWNGPVTALQMIVIDLMIKFSRQYWFTLHEDLLVNDYPNPQSWDDVMHIWSVTGIQKIVHCPVFLPHKCHWSGLPRGRQQLAFGARASSFFPPLDSDIPPNSVCRRFTSRGYLKDYHSYLEDDTHTDEEKELLQMGLEQAFELLDCLPNREVNLKSQAWHFDADTNGPTFLVNALTYRIKGIRTGPARKATRQTLAAPGTTIDALLISEVEGVSLEVAKKQVLREQRTIKKRDRRSAASKKKRKPPTRKKKAPPQQEAQQTGPTEHIEEEEEEAVLDEGEDAFYEEEVSLEEFDIDDFSYLDTDEGPTEEYDE